MHLCMRWYDDGFLAMGEWTIEKISEFQIAKPSLTQLGLYPEKNIKDISDPLLNAQYSRRTPLLEIDLWHK